MDKKKIKNHRQYALLIQLHTLCFLLNLMLRKLAKMHCFQRFADGP